MKIITLWITRTYSPNEAPEMIEAWDEFSADGNWEGMQASFEKAKATIGNDLAQWRVIDIEVSMEEIDRVFLPATVEGVATVDSGEAS